MISKTQIKSEDLCFCHQNRKNKLIECVFHYFFMFFFLFIIQIINFDSNYVKIKLTYFYNWKPWLDFVCKAEQKFHEQSKNEENSKLN